jgi:hypothetical protein
MSARKLRVLISEPRILDDFFKILEAILGQTS